MSHFKDWCRDYYGLETKEKIRTKPVKRGMIEGKWETLRNVRRVAVLGAGGRPLTGDTIGNFAGLAEELYGDICVPLNVDIRAYKTTNLVADLNKPKWTEFKDNEFDIVIAEHIAEHMRERLDFVSECLRITKNDGLLIIEVPNWKHDSAHCTLEHYTTWGRAIFDDSYINEWGKLWKIEKVMYRMTMPFTWKSFYVKGEFLGRQIDRFTHQISGLRFFIRVKK